MVAESRRGREPEPDVRPSDDVRPPEPSPPPATPAASVPTIPVRRLVAESMAFLGYPSHVAAGALHGTDPEQEMTVDDARQAIETWLARPANAAEEG